MADLRSLTDRFVASDPGLNRLMMAVRAGLGVASTLGVEYVVAQLLGRPPLIGMLLGAVVGMMGSMALADPTAAGKAVTTAILCAASAVGMSAGALVDRHRQLALVAFVVVMFLAVWVRRFGMRFFMAGMIAWVGYFFATFLQVGFAQIPPLVEAVAVAAAWTWLLRVIVVRRSNDAALRHMLQAFRSRVSAAAAAASAVLADPTERNRRRLVSRLTQVNEAALMVDGQLGEPGATLEGWPPAALRRSLVDAEHAIGTVAEAVLALAAEDGGEDLKERAVTLLDELGGPDRARARELAERLRAEGHALDDRCQMGACRLAAAAVALLDAADGWRRPAPEAEENPADFQPAVQLFAGNLPRSGATAGRMYGEREGGGLLSRLSLPSRQAIQVALATGLAIVAGQQLNERRYYWAVIAAFVAFTGTATTADTVLKAVNRVLGTMLGLGVAIVLAELTAGNVAAVIAVVVASIFLGFYLYQISYALMIFFITVMVGQLYSVFNEFSVHLMVLRLEETAIGGALGIAVAALVLPTRTGDTARFARGWVFDSLADLLAVAGPEEGRGDSEEAERPADVTAAARGVDAQLYQLRTVLTPLTRPAALRSDATRLRHRLALYEALGFHARGLARALERVDEQDLPPELVATWEALRRACEQTDAQSRPDHVAAAEAVQRADRLVDWQAAQPAHTPLGEAARHTLRLTEVVGELSDRLGSQGDDGADVGVRPGGMSRAGMATG